MQCNPLNETYTVSVLPQSGAHSQAALLRSFRQILSLDKFPKGIGFWEDAPRPRYARMVLLACWCSIQLNAWLVKTACYEWHMFRDCLAWILPVGPILIVLRLSCTQLFTKKGRLAQYWQTPSRVFMQSSAVRYLMWSQPFRWLSVFLQSSKRILQKAVTFLSVVCLN